MRTTVRILMAVISILVLFSTLLLAACGSIDTRVNNFSVGSNPSVEVDVGNGNVSLVVGKVGEINVEAVLRNPDSIDYKVYQDGDKVIVEAETRFNSRADVTMTVPESTGFMVSTGNGNIDITNVQESGMVNCGSGSMKFEGISGDVVGNIGNGDITTLDIKGSFLFNIGNGDSTVSNATGSFTVNTGNGDITVRDTKGSFALSSGNGQVRFQGELEPGSRNRLGTGNGAVTVELTGTPSVALDLEIQQRGKISYPSAVNVSEKSEYHLKGTIGDGDAELKVRTGVGNITIK